MGAEGERGRRAGDYISGRMNDAERERAERDLALDPDFRAANHLGLHARTLQRRLADEMRSSRRPNDEDDADQRWETVARRLADLPQMRPAAADETGTGDANTTSPFFAKPVGMGLHAVPGRKAVAVALALIAAFVLGYVTGKL